MNLMINLLKVMNGNFAENRDYECYEFNNVCGYILATLTVKIRIFRHFDWYFRSQFWLIERTIEGAFFERGILKYIFFKTNFKMYF